MELKYKNIVLEGMDGSSKQTQALRLQERIQQDISKDVAVISFPDYSTTSGKLVRKYLQDKKDIAQSVERIKKDSMLYTINRFQTMSDLGYYEDGGHEYKVFDRYTTSNMLYQTLDLPDILTSQYVQWLAELEYNVLHLPKPDIVFVLRVSPELSEENVKKRGLETDYFESLEVQRKVRLNIDYLARHEGWIVIDVDRNGKMRSIEDIHEEIFSYLIK